MSEAWATAELGALFELRNEKSKQIKATEYRETGDLPVIDQSERFLAGYIDDHSRAFSGKLPVIIFGDHTRVTKFIDFPFGAGADGTQILAPKPQVDARFLYYVVSQASELIGNFGYDRHLKHLRRYKANYPVSRSAQRRIAEILSTLDEAIEQTEALIAKMQQVKAGLMHDLFTRGVTPDGRLRPTREEAPELYKESPLGWIPKEWAVKPLDHHVRIVDCKHYTPDFQGEGYPFVRPRNVKVGGLELDGVDYVSKEDFLSLTDVHRPRRGDIVFSRNASFGVPCYVDTDVQFAIGQDVVIMTEKGSDTRFVFYALTASTTSTQIAKVSAGSTFGRINLKEIRKLLIPEPDMEEQRRISLCLVACQSQSQALKSEVAKLHQQKGGLMHDLLSGRGRDQKLESTEGYCAS